MLHNVKPLIHAECQMCIWPGNRSLSAFLLSQCAAMSIPIDTDSLKFN